MVGVSKHQVSLNMNYSRVKISQNLLPPDSSILEWRWSRCKSWNSTPGVDPCLLSYANKSGESFQFKKRWKPQAKFVDTFIWSNDHRVLEAQNHGGTFLRSSHYTFVQLFHFTSTEVKQWEKTFFISELISIENATQVATCNSVRGWVCKNAGFLYHNQWWIEAVWKSLPWGVLLLMRRTQHGLIQSWRTKVCWPRIFHS